jgi:catechol 2,3-dioxygenase-like lactoylglutathione lyase family enzyme
MTEPRMTELTKTEPTYVILYVKDASASAAFYGELLGRTPVEASPNFSLFMLSSGVRLGLWSRHEVAPEVTAPPGGAELAITLADADAVWTTYADFSRRKLPIAQDPTVAEFGFTFVALDPDGHRLRVFSPPAP